MKKISPKVLRSWLTDGDELAVIDVRHLESFSREHLWFAINLPLANLKAQIRRFVPRLATRLILFDDGDGAVERAAVILAGMGYSNVHGVEGGIRQCYKDGFSLVDGNYVVQHAFGFFLRDQFNIPIVRADELKSKIDTGECFILIDSRPKIEFSESTIPGSVNIPAAEVPALINSVLPEENAQNVIFHCGGITRGILGAHALLLAGSIRQIAAMDHGTKGWLACGLDVVAGKAPDKPIIKQTLPDSVIRKIAETYKLKYIAAEELIILQNDGGRTTYLIDIRSPDEYLISHPVGALSIPGEELAGMTNDNLGTLRARLCLIGDPESGNAEITASWMKHLGWEVVILQDWESSMPIEEGPEPTFANDAVETLEVNSTEAADVATEISNDLKNVAKVMSHSEYNVWREELYERYKLQGDVRFLTLDEIADRDG